MKRVLLLGCGHAHALVLLALAKNPLYGASLTLVAPHARQIYSGMLPGVIAGHYRREEAEIDVAALAARASAEVILGSVAGLEPASRTAVLSDGRRFGYDLCSLNVGSRTETPAHAISVKPFEALPDKVRFASHVAIAGGGAAGAELAMALRYRGIEVTVYSERAEFPPALERRVMRALRRRGVDLRRGMRVDAVEAGPEIVCGQSRQRFDLVLWATGAAALPWVAASGLATDARGFVQVDEALRSVSHPQVFAVGDCAATGEAKSGVHSVRQAGSLEHNLRNAVHGTQPVPYVRKPRALMLLSCGGRYAIAARGAWSAEGRWAWWWKDWIDRRWIRRLAGR